MEPPPGVETEEMNMVAALRSALTEEMERDERVMVLGEDVGRRAASSSSRTGCARDSAKPA